MKEPGNKVTKIEISFYKNIIITTEYKKRYSFLSAKAHRYVNCRQ